MTTATIDHVEFYVGDVQQTAFFLCTAYGFRVVGQGGPETGLADQRTLVLTQGDIRLVLTCGLTPDHPAAEYVRRHGDGVAVIAFATDDLDATFARAVEGGATALAPPRTYARGDARVLVAEVSGLATTTHRLVERHAEPDDVLPGAVETIPGGLEESAGLLENVDHVAVCLHAGDLGPTVRFYKEAFGFGEVFEERIEIGDQAMNSTVVQSPSGKITFTLLEPDPSRRPGQIDGFLASYGGSGVQHLAFLTEDIAGAVGTLRDRGVRFLHTPDSYYDDLAWRLGRTDISLETLRENNVLVDEDHGGQLFQIFTKPVHARQAFFFELIERHGAQTFGSRNIRALYEAVQRDASDVDQAV